MHRDRVMGIWEGSSGKRHWIGIDGLVLEDTFGKGEGRSMINALNEGLSVGTNIAGY